MYENYGVPATFENDCSFENEQLIDQSSRISGTKMQYSYQNSKKYIL